MPIDLRLDASEIVLFTDLYELTVSAAFFDHGFNEPATFEVAVRKLPPNRGYMIAAGLERLLEALENYRFDDAAIAHLDSLKLFKPAFLDYLRQLRWSGTVRALPEGTIFFAGEPVLQVHAPLIEAQLVETLVLNQIGFPSMVATKAARCVGVAGGRRLVDFGPRRSQGIDAAVIAARSSYLGGFHGSANVLAGKRYGIPVFGTMSHSFVMAHETEREAFADFTATFPKLSTLLVDTYDTVRGVRNAAALGTALREAGIKLQGVRLDSGDIRDLAVRSRAILDRAGLGEVAIFASGNLDEYKIADLLAERAPIDAFGVGTALAVSDDAPAGDFTYKLTEYNGQPRLKTSAGKISVPGRKQIFRALNPSGGCYADLVALIDETAQTVAREFRPAPADVVALLEVQLEDGKRRIPRPTLADARERVTSGLAKLDARIKAIRKPAEYPVRHSAALGAMIIDEKLHAETRQD
ncbi:MAG TPA: nicotinate phosphoribosyltransferase [Candidatus Binataceae bacterium]|nr:nicotinate phosphoribosyltransferase [Candidatus Binataceae bacterium]